MKAILLSIMLLLALLLTTSLVFASESCSIDKRESLNECKSNAKACTDQCKADYVACKLQVSKDLDECKSACTSTECIKSCSKQFLQDKRSCALNECTSICIDNRKVCTNLINDIYKSCARNASNPINCGNISAGEFFNQGCDACACSFDGKIYCEQTKLCHKTSAFIPKAACTGLYTQLCNGPYFDIVCTNTNYCVCNAEYECPADYECVTDFNIRPPRLHTIAGWKDTLGHDLGTIGICAK